MIFKLINYVGLVRVLVLASAAAYTHSIVFTVATSQGGFCSEALSQFIV